MEVKGKYNKAIIFSEKVEPEVISQTIELLNQKAFKETTIRIMPDTHAGKGCVIGFTAKGMSEKIIPNVVGVDIGCGMLTVNLGKVEIDLKEFDKHVRKVVPMGFSRANNQKKEIKELFEKNFGKGFMEIFAKKIGADFNDLKNQVGTLGGGKKIASVLTNNQQ